MDSPERAPWADVFDFPLPGRRPKPRRMGLTMVMDKGLGYEATRDLLELAAPYIDFIKLAFGTSAFYGTELLRRKVALIRAYGIDVYPGGTFLEVAISQGRLGAFLARARELGFRTIEVSDGTLDMRPEVRRHAILTAREAGFRVISEVGKKAEDEQPPLGALAGQALSDLDLGAEWVIIEGRESGQCVGIYDAAGRVRASSVAGILSEVGAGDRLIWEAPSKQQQQALILALGPDVNLGNVAPSEVLALEALRVGLRGDTLKAALSALASAATTS